MRFVYPEATIHMVADLLFEHLIFYAPPGQNFFAVEPVTNMNDGFNMYAKGVTGSGVFVLEPGQEQTATIRFERL